MTTNTLISAHEESPFFHELSEREKNELIDELIINHNLNIIEEE